MARTTAIEKHACAACGAQAEWHPGRQRLVCSYCGTEAPFEADAETGEIREIDLVRTLREMPDELRGWKAERRSVRCRSCHAISVFDAERVGQNCEFCGSPELVDYDEIKAPIRPLSLLPFAVDASRLRRAVRGWLAGKWLAPGKLRTKAMLDTVRGVYIPYWTFDARVRCPWRAQSGEYYYTSRTFRDSSGRTRTQRVRHVRWRPSSGEIEHFFDDEPVAATRGVDPGLLKSVEPFPFGDLVPYDTAYLSGFVVEHYQVVLVDAAQAARKTMHVKLYELCSEQVPGDTFRDLVIEPRFSGQTFKHVLVPIWLSSYTYRGTDYRLVANGTTGKIAGRYPKSGWKIFFLVLIAALAAVSIFLIVR